MERSGATSLRTSSGLGSVVCFGSASAGDLKLTRLPSGVTKSAAKHIGDSEMDIIDNVNPVHAGSVWTFLSTSTHPPDFSLTL